MPPPSLDVLLETVPPVQSVIAPLSSTKMPPPFLLALLPLT